MGGISRLESEIRAGARRISHLTSPTETSYICSPRLRRGLPLAEDSRRSGDRAEDGIDILVLHRSKSSRSAPMRRQRRVPTVDEREYLLERNNQKLTRIARR
jgi:hypothetical protein